MKPLIIANWKCNPQTLANAQRMFSSINKKSKNTKLEVVICPPFQFIPNLKPKKSKLKFGAQDCFWKDGGAFTGEISPQMIKKIGCQYVIIGHSERRRHLNETDEMINQKLKAAIKAGLKPILCVGETQKERKDGKTNVVLKRQLKKGLKSLKYKSSSLIVAYEPVWAIGTNNVCSGVSVQRAYSFIKNIVGKIKVIYGGSVNSKNSAECLTGAGFEGLLVGGASLKPGEFVGIIKSVE